MNTNVSNETGHEMLAAVFSGRDIEKIKKNIKSVNRKFDSLEKELMNVVDDNILWEGAKISDIWSVAYEKLLLNVHDNHTLYGFWVLKHIVDNWEIYSDKRQVQGIKEYLDKQFDRSDTSEIKEVQAD